MFEKMLYRYLDRWVAEGKAPPAAPDWYRTKVREAGRAEDFRLYYTDHADHVGRPSGTRATRLVDYSGALQQALRDLSAWVEKGVQPPDETRYKMVESGQAALAAASAPTRMSTLVRRLLPRMDFSSRFIESAPPTLPWYAILCSWCASDKT